MRTFIICRKHTCATCTPGVNQLEWQAPGKAYDDRSANKAGAKPPLLGCENTQGQNRSIVAAFPASLRLNSPCFILLATRFFYFKKKKEKKDMWVVFLKIKIFTFIFQFTDNDCDL